MSAEPFLTSALLAGMAIGFFDGALVPVTWENTPLGPWESSAAGSGANFGSTGTVVAHCKVWKRGKAPNRWEIASSSRLVIPSAITGSFSLGREKGYAFFAMNSREPAALIERNLKEMLERDKFVNPRLVSTLALEPAMLAQIRLRPEEIWSTTDLPPEKWVFSPAISAIEGATQILIALHSLRAQGVVWEIDEQGKHSPGAMLSSVVDLHPVRAAGKTWVLYRLPSPDWNSYNESPGASVHLPRALPLVLRPLGSASPKDVTNLSERAGLGPVYAADFVTLGENRWLIAAASGPSSWPILRMIVWNSEGDKISELGTTPLRVPPTQVAVRAAGGEAMCLARYAGPKGENVCVLQAQLPAK